MTEFFGDPVDQQPRPRDTTLTIGLDGYEGPLDALLALARDKKIDLTQISMTALVDQYLAFFSAHCQEDLELTADYLVMAAWLSYLKSRLLLPADKINENEPGGPEMAEALAAQLRRLEVMEEAAAVWLAKPRVGREHFARGVPEAFRWQQRPSWTEGYYEFLMNCLPPAPAPAPMFRLARSDLFSVEEAIVRMERFLAETPEWSQLQDCLPAGLRDLKARAAMATHLVASLELCRQEKAQIRQDTGKFAPVWVRPRPPDQP
jgi:segregation and condensation protein A